MKKRLLSIMLCAAMIGAMTVGCGQKEEAPAAAPEKEASTESEAASSEDATYEFTVATNTAEDSVNHLLVAKFEELLEEKSGGAVQVTLYENGQLGGDRELTEGVIAGTVDFIIGMTGSLVDFIPEAALFDMPNVFPDIETARKVLDGPILAELQAAYDAAGIKLFAYADSGFRVMTSSKEITDINSFKGVKIRTMENANHISYWQSLGANPTPMDFSELYMSLKQGTLDAQENPIDLIVANKLYEPQKYIVETNHLLHTLNMVGSKQTYDALPADIQALVDECAVEAHQYARQMADERIEEKNATVTEYGCEIITISPELRAQMVEKVSGVYDEVRAQIGDELVDMILSEVEKAQ